MDAPWRSVIEGMSEVFRPTLELEQSLGVDDVRFFVQTPSAGYGYYFQGSFDLGQGFKRYNLALFHFYRRRIEWSVQRLWHNSGHEVTSEEAQAGVELACRLAATIQADAFDPYDYLHSPEWLKLQWEAVRQHISKQPT